MISAFSATVRKHGTSLLMLSLCLISIGCDTTNGVYQEHVFTDSGEPGYITVQHCLISFRGVPNIDQSRSQEEAEKLAKELFQRAQSGEEFRPIVNRYTDDSAPGIYRIANKGFPEDMSPIVPSNKIHARHAMVSAFGDVAFSLEVGEVGLTEYDEKASPFGWHIIKRLK